MINIVICDDNIELTKNIGQQILKILSFAAAFAYSTFLIASNGI